MLSIFVQGRLRENLRKWPRNKTENVIRKFYEGIPYDMYETYILKCADNSYYVGSTGSLGTRLIHHNRGKGAIFTARRNPCVVVWHRQFNNKEDAFKEELRIKKFSRLKKEKLILRQESIWQHYKGEKYIILGIIRDMVVYSKLADWKQYQNVKEMSGSQCQIWARSKNQWLDWVDKKKKLLRFNLVSANVVPMRSIEDPRQNKILSGLSGPSRLRRSRGG